MVRPARHLKPREGGWGSTTLDTPRLTPVSVLGAEMATRCINSTQQNTHDQKKTCSVTPDLMPNDCLSHRTASVPSWARPSLVQTNSTQNPSPIFRATFTESWAHGFRSWKLNTLNLLRHRWLQHKLPACSTGETEKSLKKLLFSDTR